MDHGTYKKRYAISGMHCASCEVLIERKLKKVHGIDKVSVNHLNGYADVYSREIPNIRDLNEAISSH